MAALKVWDGTAWQTVGTQGSTGAVGPGVPSGGTAGQLLVKNSATNYDTAWKTVVQSGHSAGVTDAFGHFFVVFPVAFATVPVVVGTESSGAELQCSIYTGPSATGVGFAFRSPTGGVINAGNIRVSWVAIGT